MQALIDLLNNIKKLDQTRILFLVDGLPELVEQLNVEGQLFNKGIDSEGNVIGYYIGTDTPYTLFDTGQFYESFDIIIGDEGIEITADRTFEDGNTIFEKYGIDIIGLTDENHNQVIQYIKDNLQDILLKTIQG